MNHRMRRIVETLACERRYGIADAKGAEYSGAGSTYQETGADTLANFKKVSERIGGTPEQVLVTYLLKHIDSITTAVREAGDDFYSGTGQALIYDKGEGIVSRLDDARNYLDLLECLLIDNGHIESPRDQEGLTNTNPGIPVITAFDGDSVTVERREFAYAKAPDSVTVDEMNEARSMAAPWAELTLEEKVREHETGQIKGHDGVWRPRAAPEGTQVIPPLCWGETGELDA